MDRICVHGLNVRETDVGDYDKIITLVTQEYGKLTVTGKGVKSLKSKNMVGCQPFAYSTYVLKKSKKDSNNSTTSTSASDVSTTADPALTTTTTTTTIQLVTEPTNDPNSGFKLSRTTAYYTVGQSEYAAIISEYPAGSSEADEVWETSDPNVATVSNLGMVTAISAGECYITVSTKKDPTKEAMIKVYVSGSLN